MQSKAQLFCLLCGTVMLFAAGCYSYPYPGAGYNAAPYGTPPGGTVMPGTTYPPAGNFVAPAQPGVSLGAPQPIPQPGAQAQNPSDSTWTPPPGAGQGNSTTDPFPSNSNSNNPTPVPNYTDPSDDFFNSGASLDQNTTQPTTNSTEQSPVAFDDMQLFAQSGENQPAATRQQQQADSTSIPELEVDPFGESVGSMQQVSMPRDVDQNGSPSKPNPYDYDRSGYTWLRGIVDYDEQNKTWNIVYNLKPDASDKYSGSMTIVHDDLVSVLKTGDVVLVEGRVDLSTRDQLGKPLYIVDDFWALEPKPQTNSPVAN